MLKESDAKFIFGQSIKLSSSIKVSTEFDILNGIGRSSINGEAGYLNVSGGFDTQGKYSISAAPVLGGQKFDLFGFTEKGALISNPRLAGGLLKYASNVELPSAFPDTKTLTFSDLVKSGSFAEKLVNTPQIKIGDLGISIGNSTVTISREWKVADNTTNTIALKLNGVKAAAMVAKVVAAGAFSAGANFVETPAQQLKNGWQYK